MKKLYICNTIYHLYIVLIKEIKSNDIVDIVISDTITNYEKLYDSISKSKIFNKVMIVKESKIVINEEPARIVDILKGNKRFINDSYLEIGFDYKNYENIYIFNDWTKIGIYLIANKINYNLIEDGLNSLKSIDKLGFRNYNIFYKMLDCLDLHTLFRGQSKYCKSIEVNDVDGIKIPLNKVVEVPREELISKLSNEEKMKIYNIFIKNDNIKNDINGESVIILTQPLLMDKLVKTPEEQIKVYKSIVDKYYNQNYNIVIKPHPRDDVQYNFENCFIMEKLIPIEILNFNSNIKFSKAITVFSTAIDGINFVEEKVNLGFDYIDTILKK